MGYLIELCIFYYSRDFIPGKILQLLQSVLYFVALFEASPTWP